MGNKRCCFELTVLAGFLVLCLGIGAAGGWVTQQSVHTWYPNLVKPFWTPPAWVFPIVWTILYVMIALSGWWLFMAASSFKRTQALIAYGGQLFLNLIWSFLFFGLRSPILGLMDIVLLWFMVVLTLAKAWAVRPLAALLLIPYCIWVTYAVALNVGIWLLNR